MNDDFDIDADDPDAKAVIDVSVIVMQQEREIWDIFGGVASRWFKNRPPANAGEMTELQGILETTLEEYLENHYTDQWEAISYEHQLIQKAETVGQWFAEQWYEAR